MRSTLSNLVARTLGVSSEIMKSDHNLTSTDRLTVRAKNLGILTWAELIKHVKNLPYGRNKNRIDFGLVLSEGKGTCSSKHALLKCIADFNGVPDVGLVLGIYRMTEENTPNIGRELSRSSMEYIPEAHCYLRVDNIRIDCTSRRSDFKRIERDIIHERYIKPCQVGEFKAHYHKRYIQKWLIETQCPWGLEHIWQIRERCIKNITEFS